MRSHLWTLTRLKLPPPVFSGSPRRPARHAEHTLPRHVLPCPGLGGGIGVCIHILFLQATSNSHSHSPLPTSRDCARLFAFIRINREHFASQIIVDQKPSLDAQRGRWVATLHELPALPSFLCNLFAFIRIRPLLISFGRIKAPAWEGTWIRLVGLYVGELLIHHFPQLKGKSSFGLVIISLSLLINTKETWTKTSNGWFGKSIIQVGVLLTTCCIHKYVLKSPQSTVTAAELYRQSDGALYVIMPYDYPHTHFFRF